MSPRRASAPARELTLVYGRNAVREALRGRRRVLRLWGIEDELSAVKTQSSGNLPPHSVARVRELQELCGSPSHQGLVAEVDPYPYADAAALLDSEDALVLALDRIQDPQNLGAICRSAECAGASGVVVPAHGAVAITGAVCRASAGAVEHLPVARVTNLADFLLRAKERGSWVYGAEAGAEKPYTEPDFRGRVVLVLGSEDRGLRPRVRGACDALVSLPIRGRIASLNASAAASALLYEATRQRSDEGGG